MYIQDYQLSPVPLPGFCFPLGVHVLEGCGEQSRRIRSNKLHALFSTIFRLWLYQGKSKKMKLKLKKILKLKRVA